MNNIDRTNLDLNTSNNNLVVIDSSLDNYQTLIAGVNNADVVLLDPAQDGIAQITESLVSYQQLNSIQIFTHGSSGSLQLGSTNLDSNNLSSYSADLAAWSDSISENGDILLFGCNFGAGAGIELVDDLSQLTQADVAASNNLTGSSQLGGDWNLEVTTGEIEAKIAIAQNTLANYDSVLASYNGKEYQLTSQASSWTEAQAEAVSLGGNLVVINDAAEQAWLRQTFGSERLWIGLSDRDTEGDFQWTNGETSSYRNWTAGEPNDFKFGGRFPAGEDYTLMNWNSSGQWNDMPDSFAGTFRGVIEIPQTPDRFTYQGKEYLLTNGRTSWTEAQAEAAGLGGNLVVINDAAEQAWLRQTFGSEPLWIGLSDRDTEGNFQWVNGETSSYRNWRAGEPNDFKFNGSFPAGEDYALMNSNSSGQWNDLPDSFAGTFRGVIELGGNSNPGIIGLETSQYQVNEEAGTVDVTILRTQGSDGTVTVDYATVDAAATAGQDYISATGTVTFADGETSKTITIPVIDDSEAEAAENFGFTIDNVTGGATLLVPRTALINIIDNDSAPAFTYNGNQYLLTSSQLTWSQAQAEAVSVGGNLVSINDAGEETWLKSTFGTSEGFWIGINDLATEGNFEWISGQPVTYTNWALGEPNNAGGNQDFGRINFGANRQWDDASTNARFRGIIEIGDSNPNNAIDGTGDGLRGEYFNNIDFTDSTITRIDNTVNFNWGTGSPDAAIAPDTFSVRWTGQIESRYSENYTFRTTSDDGIGLWVNNQLIIDGFIDQGPTDYEGSIALVAGEKYDIRLEYYENRIGAVARLSWFSDSQSLEVVPQSQLYSSIEPEPILNNETVISNLNQPTAIEWTPNGDRFFIAEKGGVIKVSQNGQLLDNPFIDLSALVNGTRDRGLLDIAVHPDFFNGSPYVYALYTYDPPEVFQNSGLAGPDGNGNRAARLTRITADANTNFTTAVPGSEVVILGKNSTWDNFNAFANSTFDFDEPPAGILPDGTNLQDFLAADSESHTIGAVEFGPDGALYVSNGDGTSYNRVDPRTVRVQDIDNLSGKILRIDPITGDGLADNPFYNGNATANRSKVYQLGLRNPFRMTVDPRNGDVYVGDVGWTQWEEINSAGAGANFGWPYYEGGNGTSLQTGGYRDLPEAQGFYNSQNTVNSSILALNHAADGINAIVLGDIYTGNAFPEEYQGDLFFNDLGRGIVYNVNFDEAGNVVSFDTFTTGANIVVQIVEAPDGSLYYVDLNDGLIGRWFFS